MKPKITIRNLAREDAQAVGQLSRSSSGAGDWDPSNYERLAELRLDGWVAVVDAGSLVVGRNTGGQTVDDQIVGFLVSRCSASELEILNLAIAPEFRRAGVASTLLETCFESASKKHARNVFLEVRASNRAALALYERHGFRVSGARARYYRNPSEDAVLMTRVLPAQNEFPIGG